MTFTSAGSSTPIELTTPGPSASIAASKSASAPPTSAIPAKSPSAHSPTQNSKPADPGPTSPGAYSKPIGSTAGGLSEKPPYTETPRDLLLRPSTYAPKPPVSGPSSTGSLKREAPNPRVPSNSGNQPSAHHTSMEPSQTDKPKTFETSHHSSKPLNPTDPAKTPPQAGGASALSHCRVHNLILYVLMAVLM